MRRLTGLRVVWLFNRRTGVALLWMSLVIGIAAAINVAGIHVVGGVAGWERWLREHAGSFFVWRLLLYAVTAYGWWWMRQRVRQREPEAWARQRLLRTEVAAVIAIIVLEGSHLLRRG